MFPQETTIFRLQLDDVIVLAAGVDSIALEGNQSFQISIQVPAIESESTWYP
jgi:hypothetical protein